MYKFKIFNNLEGECDKVWREFEKKSSHNFFQDFDYIKQLVNKENLVNIVFIYYEEKIIMILPLEIKKYFIFNVLQWIGTGVSDFCNPTILKDEKFKIDDQKFLQTWKKIISNIKGFDLIFLNNQPSIIENTSNPFSKLSKISYSKVYQIILPSNFDSYKMKIKKNNNKHYYEIHRTLIKQSNLMKSSNLEFDINSSFKDKNEFKLIIKNKITQLEDKKFKHNFDEKFVSTFENLFNNENKKFVLFNLKVNSKVISICLGIVYRNTFYYYLPMILSKEFNKYKPGKILLIKIIEWCIKNKINTFDFGLGQEHYKKYFSNFSFNLYRYLSFVNLKGSVFYIFLKLYFYGKNFLNIKKS